MGFQSAGTYMGSMYIYTPFSVGRGRICPVRIASGWHGNPQDKTPPRTIFSKLFFSTGGRVQTPSNASMDISRQGFPIPVVLLCATRLFFVNSVPTFVAGCVLSCVLYGKRSNTNSVSNTLFMRPRNLGHKSGHAPAGRGGSGEGCGGG